MKRVRYTAEYYRQARAKMQELRRQNPRIDTAALAAAVGMPRNSVQRWLAELRTRRENSLATPKAAELGTMVAKLAEDMRDAAEALSQLVGSLEVLGSLEQQLDRTRQLADRAVQLKRQRDELQRQLAARAMAVSGEGSLVERF